MVSITEASKHDEQVALAEDLMEKKNYKRVIRETQQVLDTLEPHLPTVAHAARLQGSALAAQAMSEISKSGELPSKDVVEKVLEAFELSLMINPDCEDSDYQLTKVSQFLRKLPRAPPPKEVASADFDVLVVGAGAAGVGTALMLTETFGIDTSRVVLMERGAQVGETFRRWPAEMRFISPSFNQQGWTNSFDLNSISSGTSPAYSLHAEHPSGKDYATYLEAIAKNAKLNVRTLTEVLSIRDIGKSEELPLFSVDIRSVASNSSDKEGKRQKQSMTETVTARYIVWAAGEFQYPRLPPTKDKGHDEAIDEGNDEEKKSENEEDGSELCMHNSEVRSWAELPGDEYLIIGGYESGVDAAVNLSRAGKKCRVLASTPCWSVKTTDPSAELAPYTAARLRDVLAPGFSPQPQLLAPIRVLKVEKAETGGFNVTAEWQATEEESVAPNLRNLVNHDDATQPQGKEGTTLVLHTPNPPVNCTGFVGSVAAAASHLFDFAENKDDNEEMEENDGIDEKKDDGDDNEEMKENDGSDKDKEDELLVEDVTGDVEMSDTEEDDEGDDEDEPAHKSGCLEGAPLLTENDESTKVRGVFLVGPSVSQGSLSFCFVYKFRQRFAVVSKAICEGLGVDTRAAVNECRTANMFLDDLSCCGDTCGDVC